MTRYSKGIKTTRVKIEDEDVEIMGAGVELWHKPTLAAGLFGSSPG